MGPKITANELAATYADQIKGKVILTTGTSPGSLGAEFVQTIAKHDPALLILAGRNTEKLNKTVNAISSVNPNVPVKLLDLDLESLAEVRKSAETLNSWTDVPFIDVFVHSAAIMGTDYAVTADGFERQLAVNHLATFLFTNLIMPKVLASEQPRIVIVGSSGHRWGPFRWYDYGFQEGKTYNRWRAYGQSKTGQHLYVLSLAQMLAKENLQVYGLDPGLIQTNLGAHIDWSKEFVEFMAVDQSLGNREGFSELVYKSVQEGTATHVYAAFDPDLRENNGGYLCDCHVADPQNDTVRPWATSSVEADRLWKLTEKLVGEKFFS